MSRAARYLGQRRSRLLAAADRHRWSHIAITVLRRDIEIGGTLLAGALAFRLFIWLLPCCLLVAAVLGFTASSGRPVEELSRELGMSPLTVSVVGQVGAQAEHGRYLTAAIGIVLLCWASLTLGRALDGVHLKVWGSPADRGVGPTFRRAARYLAALLAIVVGNVAGSVVATTLHHSPAVISLPSLVFYLTFGTLMLSADWPPRWRRVLPGATLVALGIEGLHLVAVLYLPGRLDRASQLYGTLGIAAALLVWLALVARLIVLGQVLNAVLSEPRQGG